MMEKYLLAIIFVPIAGAFALPLIGRISKWLRNFFALVFVALPLIFSLKLAPIALSGTTLNYTFGLFPHLALVGDPLAFFMAITSSLISAIIILYSFGYISHYSNQNEYYMVVVLFLGSMMGIVFSSNLLFLYIFWEITAICSWRLIGFFREKTDVLAADKAFLVTFFGALVMLLGFILIYFQTGSFDLDICKNFYKMQPVSNLIVCMILFGILSKSATLPFQTWLPDAGVAPSPVTALLHAAVLVKIGVYVFARLFVATFPIEAIWHVIVPSIAVISAIVAGTAAFMDTDLKRIIAYSTISQIGFIFFGLAIGNEVGLVAGLLYILMHGLAKAGLFLCTGIIEQNTHTKDINKLGGLIKFMPFTAIAFLLCAFSVMGIPPLGGFFAKYLLFMGGIESGNLWLSGLFLLAAVFTIIYLFRVFKLVFLGDAQVEAREGSKVMVFSVVLLAVLSLAGGIFVSFPLRFAQDAAKQMLVLIR